MKNKKIAGVVFLMAVIAISLIVAGNVKSEEHDWIYDPESSGSPSEDRGNTPSATKQYTTPIGPPAPQPKSQSFLQKYSGYFSTFWGSGKDPPAPQKQWYEVEQWEIEYCSKYGGHVSPESSAEVISSQISQLTATLQGSKKKQSDNTTLYEVSYYIQPISSSIPYVVEVLGKSNGTTINKTISRGTAYPSGTADYEAFYSEENYNQVRMTYGGNVLSVELPDYDKAKIMQKNISINATTTNATTALSLTCAEKGGTLCPRKCPEGEVKDICPAACTGTIVDSRDGGPKDYGTCCIGRCE
ncbi:MAG TPA: hypothetical protein VI894_02745 [Candidatus Nanoarchaeia archaeon]|nr:hypothetical protein [Candidatus Nanoarchaeia archaeon]